MNLKQLKEKRTNLLKEIDSATEERFGAIRKEIEKIDYQIAALEREAQSADNEERAADITAAMRPANGNGGTAEPALRMAFNAGQSPAQTPIKTPDSGMSAEIAKMSKRDKLALVIGRQARNKQFTEPERRELGVALTTTATKFVTATETENGINNAGVFINTKALFDFLKEEQLVSPIVADIAMTHIAGLTSFPYRKSRDKANAKGEGEKGKDNQWEWANLEGTKGYLQSIIVVTDEILALSDFDLGDYIMDQMMQDINEDWGSELIYADGSTKRVKGLTKFAKAKTYSGDVNDAIIEGIKACIGKFRRGAKIYAAQDVHDSITFAKDKNGAYMYPVINNATGVITVGSFHIEVDENILPGEFIIGNVKKFFKVNAIVPLRLETDRVPRMGTTEYVASGFCATAAYPEAFQYYKKA